MNMNLHEIDMPSKPALPTVLPKSAGKAERLEEWSANVGSRTIILLEVINRKTGSTRYFLNRGKGYKRISERELGGALIAFRLKNHLVTQTATHDRHFKELSK